MNILTSFVLVLLLPLVFYMNEAHSRNKRSLPWRFVPGRQATSTPPRSTTLPKSTMLPTRVITPTTRLPTPSASFCYSDGKSFNIGEAGTIHSPSGCKWCTCRPTGTLKCYNFHCDMFFECNTMVTLPGRCCPICDCVYNGERKREGSTWWHISELFPGHCNKCTCNNGKAMCRYKSCKLWPKSTFKTMLPTMVLPTTTKVFIFPTPTTRVLPTRPSASVCYSDGKSYNIGDKPNIPSHSGCKMCTCKATGTLQCQEVYCDMFMECNTKVTPPGKCCPICDCVHNGERKSEGSTWWYKSTWFPDRCNECTCRKGRAVCAIKSCPTPSSLRSTFIPKLTTMVLPTRVVSTTTKVFKLSTPPPRWDKSKKPSA